MLGVCVEHSMCFWQKQIPPNTLHAHTCFNTPSTLSRNHVKQSATHLFVCFLHKLKIHLQEKTQNTTNMGEPTQSKHQVLPQNVIVRVGRLPPPVSSSIHNLHSHLASHQWPGRFLGIINWDPCVCKFNGLHVDILRFSFIKLGHVLMNSSKTIGSFFCPNIAFICSLHYSLICTCYCLCLVHYKLCPPLSPSASY